MNEEANIKVLLVEDEFPILKGISTKFQFEGFKVLTAQDGKEGLEVALREHPDIILIDYRMPVMDGFEALGKLRQDEWGRDAKVIMWTNSYGLDTREKAKELRAIDFMVKSDWEYRDVVKRVREILGLPPKA